MVRGQTLRAIVCTGTLDLGIDWGDVDLIIQVGARRKTSNAWSNGSGAPITATTRPSKALLVPANRFEVVECHRRACRPSKPNTTWTETRAAPALATFCVSTS